MAAAPGEIDLPKQCVSLTILEMRALYFRKIVCGAGSVHGCTLRKRMHAGTRDLSHPGPKNVINTKRGFYYVIRCSKGVLQLRTAFPPKHSVGENPWAPHMCSDTLHEPNPGVD